MLKILIKKQLLELFQTYFIDKKTGKSRTKKGTIVFFILLVFLFLCLGFAFYSMASGLGGLMLGGGFNWLYFALMSLLAMLLGVFGSVFNTYASVYLPKDNELLMSLPIPAKTLLLARLSGVYITSLMYSAWVWIPTMIAYWIIVPVNALNVIFPILLTFVIAFFVAFLSCILGWVVALIASKTKGKSFITVLFSLAFIAIYYFVYFKIVGSVSEIMAHLGEIEATMKSWIRYSYWLGMGADGDIVSMLIVIFITAALCLLCFIALSKTFTRLSAVNSSGGGKTKKPANYTEKPISQALVSRELKHFTSVATWMLNGGLGLLIMMIATVVLFIKSGSIRAFLPEISVQMPNFYDSLPIFLLAAICLILSTDSILPVSVSIEGKTLWQLQSLPVTPLQVLQAKERMCIRLSILPAFWLALAGGIVLKFGIFEKLLVIIGVCIFVWLISDFGLFLNLKMPNMNWTNAASLTKQSMPVVINMFGGWAFSIVLGVGGFFLTKYVDAWVILLGYTVLFAVLLMLLKKWINGKGCKIFVSL